MIIWLNGPFGAGKSTLSGELRARIPNTLLFDPEEIGFVVRAVVPPAPSGDFQDLPIWRRLTLAALLELHRGYSQAILVPMTMANPDYLAEILGGLAEAGVDVLHIYLDIDKQLLRGRIKAQIMHDDPERDEEIQRWRLAQVERCLAARAVMPAGTRFLDSGRQEPGALADRVIAWLQS